MRALVCTLAAWAALLNVPVSAGPLVADAGLARYALAADQGVFLDWLDPRSREVFAEAMGGDHGALGPYWETLMTGAVQLRREDGDSGETLWFNPLFDAGLAARWERSGEVWSATHVVPMTGEMLRGEALSMELAPFVGAIKPEAEARATSTWRAAHAADWFALDVTGAGTAVLSRMAGVRAGLDSLRASAGYDNAGIMARTALATGDDRALPPEVRAGLAMTGPAARLSLRPVAGYRRPDGWTMALQSPDAPMLTWLVHFADPASPGGEATILGFQVLQLGDAS